MSTIADDLGTTYFQLSTVGVGALAVGIQDIRQRIFNVLNTIPGSDPFRQFFGSNVYLYNDKPVTVAIPNIKKEIFTALDLWMPELEIVSITHEIIDGTQLTFEITYTLVDDDLTDTITFNNGVLTGDTVANSIIITALVPVKVTNGIYHVSLTINGADAYPVPPAVGWSSAEDMLQWINTNWLNYGKWYLTGTALLLYLDTSIASTASLTVTEEVTLTVKAQLPPLSPGEYFSLALTVDTIAASPAFLVDTIFTAETLLAWVNSNWGTYGSWFIESNGTTFTGGDFSNDFEGDFDLGGFIDNTYLVFQTKTAIAATLNFNA